MRTPSGLDTALLASPSASRANYIRVEVDRDNAGTWVDLSDWAGVDFVRSVTYDESINTPAWSASVALSLFQKDRPALSLSPLMANSLVNAGGVLCEAYHRIRISTATVPIGDQKPGVYNEVFVGRIDSWAIRGGQLDLACRDQTSDLMGRFVKVEAEYGSDTPTTATANELQEIIQNLIDDHYNTASDISGTASAPRTSKLSARTTDGAPYQLYSVNGTAATPWNAGDDTGWSLRRFMATKSPLWQWLTRLAGMIGYKLRFRWHSGSGIDAFVLVLEHPDRTSPSVVLTLDPTAGQCRIPGIGNDIQNVRNSWVVGYVHDGGIDDSYPVEDLTSIGKYGEKFAEVFEGSSSQIDTEAEAMAMADALLSDTKEPIATVQVDVPYLWYPEVNDLVRVKADGIHFDSDQDLVTIARQNTISQGGAGITKLTLQGTLEVAATRKPQRVYDNPRSSPASKSAAFSFGGSMVGNSNFAESGNE